MTRYKQEAIKVPGDNRKRVGFADSVDAQGKRNLAQALTGLARSQEDTSKAFVQQQGALQNKNAATGRKMAATANLSAAHGQVGNQYGRTAQSDINRLSQKLNQFSQTLDNAMQQDATMKAREAGIIDTADRRKQILDIQVKYANDPKKMQEKIDEVSTATLRDNFSVYGRVYQNTANAAYASQVEIDAKNASIIAQNESLGDPAAYKRIYQEYTKQKR